MIHDLSRRLGDRDEFRFFLHWLRQPGHIGAVIPSGAALAMALAAEIDIGTRGAVVELGPGTGQVTGALLGAGVAPGRLIAIERDTAFCELLRTRFPDVGIVSGDARALGQIILHSGIGRVKAVVSSLPLLSMTRANRRAVLVQIAAVLALGGELVQYTYGPGAPVPKDLGVELGLTGERTNWVLANLPPAAIWRYRRDCSVPGLSAAA